jgi:hypothetical protein
VHLLGHIDNGVAPQISQGANVKSLLLLDEINKTLSCVWRGLSQTVAALTQEKNHHQRQNAIHQGLINSSLEN